MVGQPFCKTRFKEIDGLRGIAVTLVLLYHFGWLAHGYLGVHLFFILSGFLISQPFLDALEKHYRFDVFTFYVRRAAKILPSYYVFIFGAAMVSALYYSEGDPGRFYIWDHAFSYLFLVMNYRGWGPWICEHLWSLCVEVHFYLIFPIILGLVRKWGTDQRALPLTGIFLFVAAAIFRNLGYFVGFETISATHNRIDALAMGVLLAWFYRQDFFYRVAKPYWLLLMTASLFLIWGCTLFYAPEVGYFSSVWYHTITAFCLMMITAAVLGLGIAGPRIFTFLSRYSYNLYLWHVLFVWGTQQFLGRGLKGFLFYAATSFLFAIVLTKVVEEPMSKAIKRIGSSQKGRMIVLPRLVPTR